jgi:hypothetical protein
MPSKRVPSKKKKSNQLSVREFKRIVAHSKYSMLAMIAGILFFFIELSLLLAASTYGLKDLTGLLTTLWLLGGLSFAIGVTMTARNAKSDVLLLSGPAISFAVFAVLVLFTGFGKYFLYSMSIL